MKILFCPCHYIYDEFYGGSEYSWAFNIADRIASKNPKSVVVTGFKNLNKVKKYEIIEVQKWNKRINMRFTNAALFSFKYFWEAERQLRRRKIDIIHHVLPFNINNTFNLSIIFRRGKTPSVIGPVQSPLSFQGLSKMVDNEPLKLNLSKLVYYLLIKPIKYLSNLTLKKSDVVVVVNEHTKNILIENGIEINKIVIIPPGIDIKQFRYTPFKNKDSKKIELLVVCYLVKRKAVDLVIKAVSEVVKEKNNIVLRIVGEGPQKENLKNLVKELNLQDCVIFEGFIENSKVQKYYNRAHIFVSMSRSESWGQMYLEAMASGLPIVTTKNNGSLSIIKNENFAYLVEQEDYIGLSKKLLGLIGNFNLIAEFGENARIEAEKYYDWDRCIIPEYLRLYKNILE